jgi:hypothetical protein
VGGLEVVGQAPGSIETRRVTEGELMSMDESRSRLIGTYRDRHSLVVDWTDAAGIERKRHNTGKSTVTERA